MVAHEYQIRRALFLLEERASQAVLEGLRKQYSNYTPAPDMVPISAGSFLVGLSIGDLRECPPDYTSMRQNRCSNKPVEP